MVEGLFCAPPRPTVKTGLFTPVIVKDNLLIGLSLKPRFFILINESTNVHNNKLRLNRALACIRINQPVMGNKYQNPISMLV